MCHLQVCSTVTMPTKRDVLTFKQEDCLNDQLKLLAVSINMCIIVIVNKAVLPLHSLIDLAYLLNDLDDQNVFFLVLLEYVRNCSITQASTILGHDASDLVCSG